VGAKEDSSFGGVGSLGICRPEALQPRMHAFVVLQGSHQHTEKTCLSDKLPQCRLEQSSALIRRIILTPHPLPPVRSDNFLPEFVCGISNN